MHRLTRRFCRLSVGVGVFAAGGSFCPPSALAQDACPDGLEVMIERTFAAGSDLTVFDRVRVGPAPGRLCEAVVVGVFEPPADPATLTRERPRVLFHLGDLARLAERPDEVDRFTLRLARTADTAAVVAALGAVMPGAQVLRAGELADRSSATFRVVQRFHVAIAWITLSASGIFLACLMTLRVYQRRLSVSALRLTGISRRTLFAWLLVETTLVSVLGAAVGIGIGYAASAAINAFYQRSYDTSLLFSLVGPAATLPAMILSIGLGLFAGAVAATFLLRADPLVEAGR